MKNDIDSLLEAMFRNGKLNLKSSASTGKPGSPEKGKEPPALEWDPAENAAKAGRDLAAVERLAQATQADLADLELHLKQDGVESASAGNSGSPKNLEAAFASARKEAGGKVLGQ